MNHPIFSLFRILTIAKIVKQSSEYLCANFLQLRFQVPGPPSYR